VRGVLSRIPNRLYNQLFDEATVLRAQRARERLEALGYEFPTSSLRDGRDWRRVDEEPLDKGGTMH
jgi:hypothetical protein